jgi:hypothetical protein
VRHQPGRGHDRKSATLRKKRFSEKKQREREEHEEELRKMWEQWDKMSDGAKKLRPELKPTEPRPPDAR